MIAMTLKIYPSRLRGELPAVPSKSAAHRLLICAALADVPTRVVMPDWPAEDIRATIRCLRALGAEIGREGRALVVTPVATGKGAAGECAEFDCGESGSTLRFLLPIAAALQREARFTGAGRLPERPLGPMIECLRTGGATLECESPLRALPLALSGRLSPGAYRLPGDVSSQFISGLLLALPLLPEGGEIRLTGALESASYVEMTIEALARFSVRVEQLQDGFRVPPGQRYKSPGEAIVEGDWSNMAFFLAAGALGGPVTCTGLSADSAQGDREILAFLERFGARIERGADRVTVTQGALRAIEADVSQTPDLAPALAALAALSEGESLIDGAGRLRMKEVDRLRAIRNLLAGLGSRAEEGENSLRVTGQRALPGGCADGAGDHRMAMAAAIMGAACDGASVLTGAESVAKSYPSFFEDFKKLGGRFDVLDNR